MDSPALRRVPDKHGNLQRNQAALDELEGILTARPVRIRAAGVIEATVDLPELILAGESLTIRVSLPARGPGRRAAHCYLRNRPSRGRPGPHPTLDHQLRQPRTRPLYGRCHRH